MQLLRPNRKPLTDQIKPKGNLRLYGTLLTLVFLTSQLHRFPYLDRISGVALDSLLQGEPLPLPSECRLVLIRSSTIERHFHNRTPLPATDVINAIKILDQYAPAVIAVDILTTGADYTNVEIPKTQSTVVWARGYDSSTGLLSKVLGRDSLIPGISGVALFAKDASDRRIRRYYSFLDDQSLIPTFSHAIIESYCRERRNEARCISALSVKGTQHRLLRFFDDNLAKPLDLFLDNQIGNTSEYRNKIIILGGDYGNDVHPTPLGTSTGSRLVMSAVESSFGNTQAELPSWIELVLKLSIGFTIALIHKNLMPAPAAVSTIAIAALIAIFTSFLLLSIGYWANMTLILIGMWIEQMYETVELAQHELAH
jgi:CHASE2 domain-containing sensor protein